MGSTTIAVVFVALICATSANLPGFNQGEIHIMTWGEFLDFVCKSTSATGFSNWAAVCNARTTTTTIETTTSTLAPVIPPSQQNSWCRFDNNTYAAVNYTFMSTECRICRCTETRAFGCYDLTCMPTHCVDGSTPAPKPGQCCPQCSYETQSIPCMISNIGVPVPHGTILRQTTDGLQCWCQMGNVECRKSSAGGVFSGLDYWGSGTAVYVVVIIICVILILGTLVCCGGTLLFYYYYKRRQQVAEQNYAEYYNNAGWQPMPEDGQVVDEKQAEATQNEYPIGQSSEPVPPPYAIYNSSYGHEEAGKDGDRF